MTRFVYKAKDWNGKIVKGVADLASRNDVVESIRGNGLVPLAVEPESKGLVQEIVKAWMGRAGLKEITTFTRQLSTMLISGLPLTESLSLLKNQTEGNGQMFEILDYVLDAVRGGQSLGDALTKYKKVFGEAYVASINAGEAGGVLEEVLGKLAEGLEKETEFKGKVKGAMIYPVIVIIGMVIVAFIMMVFVIPKLLSLYADFGSKLPTTTLILMQISSFTTKYWFVLPLIVFGIYSILKVGNQNENFRLNVDTYKFRIPIWGELAKKNVIANTLRTLSMLLAAGIPLVTALKIVSKVADSELYYQAYMKIADQVQKGYSIANSFEETEIFPPIVNQMVSTGEATGKLDDVLMRVSDYFSMEAEQSVKSLTSAIEPLIMVVLGLGVAFLVIAVIMPIYNLTSQF